ncbi:methyltransferase type 11 [Chryseobacterium phocaeense]|uniref:methyltransferase type 11 n=1 Tax=Chryseobacterium phocaeense TaxID=1816690 RepID=UPI0009B9A1C4|nr:methyltransferase type 11 [Chryseobacterium phocaeense]
MKTVEIFKTNVLNGKEAGNIITFLITVYPEFIINFDLEDTDNILRIEANQFEIEADNVIKYMIELGYSCERIE